MGLSRKPGVKTDARRIMTTHAEMFETDGRRVFPAMFIPPFSAMTRFRMEEKYQIRCRVSTGISFPF
jgi:hypothetical protein